MQNALYYQIVWLGVCSLLISCQTRSESPSPLSTEEIQLEDSNGWILTISGDGSGSMACQSLQHEVVHWPSGTFPFKKVRLLPAFEPRVQDRYPFRWTYWKAPESDYRQYSLPDTSWAVRWFVMAHEALIHQQAPSHAQRQLRRQWQVRPPIGVK